MSSLNSKRGAENKKKVHRAGAFKKSRSSHNKTRRINREREREREQKNRDNNLPLLVVNAGQVSVDDCIVGTEIQSAKISGDSSVTTIKSTSVSIKYSLVRGGVYTATQRLKIKVRDYTHTIVHTVRV